MGAANSVTSRAADRDAPAAPHLPAALSADDVDEGPRRSGDAWRGDFNRCCTVEPPQREQRRWDQMDAQPRAGARRTRVRARWRGTGRSRRARDPAGSGRASGHAARVGRSACRAPTRTPSLTSCGLTIRPGNRGRDSRGGDAARRVVCEECRDEQLGSGPLYDDGEAVHCGTTRATAVADSSQAFDHAPVV
jgi:hypothetical protein